MAEVEHHIYIQLPVFYRADWITQAYVELMETEIELFFFKYN